MHFRLNCLSGSVAGKSFEFDLPQVLVGREESCQLKLNSVGENRVSGRHCELFEQDGKLYVRDLDSLNGTLVDDVRIDKPTVLRPGSRLQLGSKGSLFVVELLSLNANATLANTFDGVNAAPLNAPVKPGTSVSPAKQGVGLQTMERKIEEAVGAAREDAEKAHASQKKHTVLIAASVLIVALLAAGAVWKYTHKDIGELAGRQEKSETEMKDQLSAISKRYAEIESRVAKNETEMREQLASLGAELNNKSKHLAELEQKLEQETSLSAADREKIKNEIASGKTEVAALNSTIEKYQAGNKELFEKAVAPFKAVADSSKDSVYSVFLRSSNEKYTFIATAFAINPVKGLLGTNGHVAKPVADMMADGKTIMVRCNSNPRFTYHVKKAVAHPDYQHSGDGVIKRQTADVGILELDLFVDGSTLTMPGYLHPATPEDLDKLTGGDVVALLGFPGDYAPSYEKPDGSTNVAKLTTGVISAKTSFTGMKIDGREFDVLEHTCASTGGNSGSPIFNSGGRVVSILNSGKAIQINSNVRLPLGAVNWGVNVRFLKQLLDTQYGPGAWN